VELKISFFLNGNYIKTIPFTDVLFLAATAISREEALDGLRRF
jgi:hypothetical protein